MNEEIVIISDPEICHGKPVIKGTRVPVKVIVDMLKRGYSPEEIHEEYPSVPIRAIRMINERIRKKERLLAEIKVS